MIITPELKAKQQKILDIFKRMTLDEQYIVVGYLSEYADQNRMKNIRRNLGGASKVVLFPAVTAM